MDVKEKLEEILVEPCGGLYPASELADYLIANGVTVSVPCSECIYSDMGEHEFCNQSISREKWDGNRWDKKEHKLECCGYGKRKEKQ